MKQKPVLSQEELAKLATIVQPVEPPTPEGETPPQVEAADTADFEAQLAEKDAKIGELTASIEDIKIAMTTEFTAKLEAQGAKLDTLKSIVAGQVKSMRVALSLADVDINAMDVDAVLSEYKATSELFCKSLPIGGLVKKEEEKPAVKAIQSSHDQSNIKALGFK